MEQPAIAVYFQDMTAYVEQLSLQKQILDEKSKAQNLQNFTSTISHEFRTPLGTSLMFLE